jgi:hypothetical protein
MDPAARLTNGALSRSESERLKKQIHDADRPRESVDLSHLEPSRDRSSSLATAAAAAAAVAGATTIAVRGGRNRRSPPHQRRRSLHPSDERQARHPRDEALTPRAGASRPQSPEGARGVGHAQPPAVDFDGLSWPSM